MRTNSDCERQRDEALLDAMLQDDTWQAASAALKGEALSAFHAGHRLRRVRRWAVGVAALAVLIAIAAYYVEQPAAAPRQLAASPAPTPEARTPGQPQRLTDQELLAAFPKGSCFIAEIDGKKQLVFVKPQLANIYMAPREPQPN